MAQQLGVNPAEVPHSKYDFIPSVVIGAAAVKPIEMAGAYAAVADDGVFHTPSFINTVSDRTGNIIYRGLYPGRRVFSQQIAAEADVALRAVVTGGTGTAASLYNRPVAGKTGTTSNNVDAWFNGFTPQLETTVWMGNLQGEVPIIIHGYAVFGADYPAHTWHDYSAVVLANQPVLQLPQVQWGLMPPTRFITSLSLVHDDVLDHNFGVYTCGQGIANYQGAQAFQGGACAPTTTAPPVTVAPTTVPATTPTTKSPPTTRPKKH